MTKSYQRYSGFSLPEIVAAIGMLAIVSSILVPLVGSNIESSMITRASAEIKEIHLALTSFRTDTGEAPTRKDSSSITRRISAQNLDSTRTGTNGFDKHLRFNDMLYRNWNGPYISKSLVDPWAEGYIITVKGFCPGGTKTRYVWILSGGINRAVESDFTTVPHVYDASTPRLKAGTPEASDIGMIHFENVDYLDAGAIPCKTFDT